MKKKFFSIVIATDSGRKVTTLSLHSFDIYKAFYFLVVMLHICLFFIVRYHVKIRQEAQYREARNHYNSLLVKLRDISETVESHQERLVHIRENDRKMRFVAIMNSIDNSMYEAGIGGHVIVNDSDYAQFEPDVRNVLKKLGYDIVTVNSKIRLFEKSLGEIRENVHRNRDIINNTPSIYPTHFSRITSGFGWRTHPITMRKEFHRGVDLRASMGQPVFAAADGIITYIQKKGKLGKCVIIEHRYGYRTLYGHLNDIEVTTGQKVTKGEIIGTVGRTGRATGVHLHYGVYLNGTAQDPMVFFN